jgi:hypothetical protein
VYLTLYRVFTIDVSQHQSEASPAMRQFEYILTITPMDRAPRTLDEPEASELVEDELGGEPKPPVPLAKIRRGEGRLRSIRVFECRRQTAGIGTLEILQ